MLYGLYASTFFFNVLFYLELLRKTSAVNLPITNLVFMGLCTLGMIIYGFFAKKLPTARRYPSLCLALLLSGVGGVLLFSTMGGHLFLIIALFLFAPAFGYVSGDIAYRTACNVPVRRQGFFVGTSLALANSALYFALLFPVPEQLPFFMAAVMISTVLLRKIHRQPLPAPLPTTDNLYIRRHLPLAVMIAALLGALVGLDDSIFIPNFAEYEASFFGMSRLFTAGGFLLAGFIADKWPFYLPLIAIAAKSIPLFVRAGCSGFVLSLLAYTDAFFTGALIVLVIRLFFFIAPYTRRPRLWVSMGRGIELPASGIAALFGTLYLENSSLSVILTCHAGMLLLCALLFYQVLLIYARIQKAQPITTGHLAKTYDNTINNLTSGELSLAGDGVVPLLPSATATMPDLATLQKQYELTARETEVLGEVLQDKPITDIAAALFVTERTVKFHIGNLLKKTSCQNQRELRKKLLS